MARTVQTTVTVTCDICGISCEVTEMNGARIQIIKDGNIVSLDLCSEHATALEAWIEQEKAAGNHS